MSLRLQLSKHYAILNFVFFRERKSRVYSHNYRGEELYV